ncbi:hypothetical protein SCOCK_160123 [Actinacidiphila cocklensis]|uniref:Uncharacterized protein n=1 Tax=Actinacidiphila cocklensis TaxID=887465 RepID=A0A9W4DJ45_9ACTN|nr:hypothetical protein SCOCK_160123 [Actinacidiphila cocklensis]
MVPKWSQDPGQRLVVGSLVGFLHLLEVDGVNRCHAVCRPPVRRAAALHEVPRNRPCRGPIPLQRWFLSAEYQSDSGHDRIATRAVQILAIKNVAGKWWSGNDLPLRKSPHVTPPVTEVACVARHGS